jgi:acylphosphatase
VIRQYRVEGRVQGVGFRWFVRREAARLGVAGWVRNNPDGSVEAVAHGTAEQLTEFEAALRRGPAMSKVTNLHVSEKVDEGGSASAFEIV